MRKPQKPPLSDHAIAELRTLAKTPLPRCSVNPGVVHRLLGDELAELVQLPSPFPSHRGAAIQHMQITPAGRAIVHKLEAAA